MISTLILLLHLAGVIPAEDAINFLYISGALLLVAELFVTSLGLLALNGCIAIFIAYALQTGDHTVFGVPIDWPFIFGIAVLELVLIVLAALIFLHYRKFKVTTGTESMVGEQGEVLSWKGKSGRVLAQGEPWKAESKDSLQKGDMVKITSVDGLILKVKKI